jgi:ATP-dependent Clp protease adaptor protein ClpS
MATITKEQVFTSLQDILSSPYILWLHNDNYNTFDHVINCLMKICKHEQHQAEQCAHLVHFTGKCDVKRGDKEIITEMYNKLKGAGLSVTMELA